VAVGAGSATVWLAGEGEDGIRVEVGEGDGVCPEISAGSQAEIARAKIMKVRRIFSFFTVRTHSQRQSSVPVAFPAGFHL